jgi:glycosyltransferase involved in cell wall biosynthesis
MIVQDGDIQKMAEAISCLLEDDELRSNYSAAARVRAKDLFDASEAGSKTEAFYKTIAGAARKSVRFD